MRVTIGPWGGNGGGGVGRWVQRDMASSVPGHSCRAASRTPFPGERQPLQHCDRVLGRESGCRPGAEKWSTPVRDVTCAPGRALRYPGAQVTERWEPRRGDQRASGTRPASGSGLHADGGHERKRECRLGPHALGERTRQAPVEGLLRADFGSVRSGSVAVCHGVGRPPDHATHCRGPVNSKSGATACRWRVETLRCVTPPGHASGPVRSACLRAGPSCLREDVLCAARWCSGGCHDPAGVQQAVWGDDLAVRQELTGVLEEKNAVAQQAPALLRVVRHEPGGLPIG